MEYVAGPNLGIDATGGECACKGLDGGRDGDLSCEGLNSWGLHLVVTRVIPASSGPDKERVPVLLFGIKRSEALGRVWSSGCCIVFYDAFFPSKLKSLGILWI